MHCTVTGTAHYGRAEPAGHDVATVLPFAHRSILRWSPGMREWDTIIRSIVPPNTLRYGGRRSKEGRMTACRKNVSYMLFVAYLRRKNACRCLGSVPVFIWHMSTPFLGTDPTRGDPRYDFFQRSDWLDTRRSLPSYAEENTRSRCSIPSPLLLSH
ncbi:hypothetical protein VTK73DRAFT_7235 [Phialemonium thermophilum]|uniref:Uncharacterized protein n=1 Tax=Phialemonium thermophilum TaxID=223376 RepID=A0ABR3WFU6_9PEZI